MSRYDSHGDEVPPDDETVGEEIERGRRDDERRRSRSDPGPTDRGGESSSGGGTETKAGAGCGCIVIGLIALVVFALSQRGGNQEPTNPSKDAGRIVIRSAEVITVEAFVEVDGVRVTGWQRGTQEVSVPSKAGERRVVYRSKANGKYFKNEFAPVTVPAGGDAQLSLTGVVPDPSGRW